MADRVPTTGPWQTDPELARLMAASDAARWTSGSAEPWRRGTGDREAMAVANYVKANRRRLGIPDNYYPDPRTQGRTLYDPNQNQLRDAAIVGGTMAVTGGVLGAAGGGAAGASSASAAGGVLPSSQLPMSPLYTGPVVGGSQGVSAGLGAAGAAGAAGADYLGDKPSAASRMARAVAGGGEGGANPWVKAALAALSGVPALIATQKNKPTAEELAMQQQIQDMLASQQRRTTYQDPLFESVSRLAMSRLPTGVQRDMGEM